ncbi:thymidine phosphorylase [Paracoccaceae bacterium GXU_MW_L88]
MLPQEVIALKRDGKPLPEAAIQGFVDGLTSGDWSDAQIAALAMAILLNDLGNDERVTLTTAMRDSGDVLDWDLPGPVVDKHSTGGVGDNVSLMLAPALAACGAYVPMISGRGLGHTGGTLDKFDAIPGYDTAPDLDTLRQVTRDVGCAIIGQTGDIAPADKRFYSIRDITATVESIDLITASILSKKLSAGLDALVLDVKCGSGAFMATPERARRLAEVLVEVANGAGCKTSALVTDMNEPLASAAGNALEMRNAVEFLTMREVDGRLWDVTTALGGTLLASAGLATDAEDGEAKMAEAFQSGAAAERFGQMVSALGGPSDFMERFNHHLPVAPIVEEIFAPEPGFVQSVNAREIGQGVVELGGGRRQVSDTLDYSVGYDWLVGVGDMVDGSRPLARIHAATSTALEEAKARLLGAYVLGETAPEETPLILERIAP